MSELSDKMVVYRALHRISQRELAKLCGVSVQTICSVETGQQSPSRITETKIRLIVDKEEEEQC